MLPLSGEPPAKPPGCGSKRREVGAPDPVPRPTRPQPTLLADHGETRETVVGLRTARLRPPAIPTIASAAPAPMAESPQSKPSDAAAPVGGKSATKGTAF